ncbi:thioesterase family protein [Deferribacterales bacterium RsTz2092]|nr:hypothetical protein AGMMS49941_01970 [Deferribacterales bacterium]
MNELAKEIERRILGAPFHQWMNINVIDAGEGFVEMTATYRDEWLGNPDKHSSHGGIVAGLIDLAADFSLYTYIGRGVPTIDLRVDFLAPAIGNLMAVGKAIKYGKRISTAEANIYNADGKLVASGRGTFLTC